MIRITQLKLHPEEGPKSLERAVRKHLHLKDSEAFSYEVLRRSIDARKKPDLYEIYTLQVQFKDSQTERRILRKKLSNVEAFEPVRYRFAGKPLKHRMETITNPDRPLIIGTGPAGLFCGLLLAREGLCPILIERGQRAKEREKSVRSFWETGTLDPDSNVQFGEGGAGTFSDGKLNTGVKDPGGRIRFILETFVQFGADPDILSSAKPHVGTDILKRVVASITQEICERGGEVHFSTRMEKMHPDQDGIWQVSCVSTAADSGILDGSDRKTGTVCFSARHLVLAIGHSSRDTFCMLKDSGIIMRPKAFAVGVRIQHPQEIIDRAMYGENCRYDLPVSSYKLTHRLANGRGVYSFCMCPGGYIVNASSEEGGLAVNGMSYHDRSSKSANSAIVVTVSPEEIARYLHPGPPDPEPENGSAPIVSSGMGPLLGMEFQRQLERAAHLAGGGAIPVQRFGDFLRSDPGCGIRLPDYEPRILGRWKPASIRQIFPEDIAAGIEEGILSWERQISGFSSPDALLCAAESRTSSPVRIERGPDLQALDFPGLYPCGEGAGYAGGITSAAADGLRVAEQILEHTARIM